MKIWPQWAAEAGITDLSEESMLSFIHRLRQKFPKWKRMNKGHCIRLQEWFGWNTSCRSDVLPNWSFWFSIGKRDRVRTYICARTWKCLRTIHISTHCFRIRFVSGNGSTSSPMAHQAVYGRCWHNEASESMVVPVCG